jgi:hypothetical protein
MKARPVAIDPCEIDFPPEPRNVAYVVAPVSFPAHGARKAIPRGAVITFDFQREPGAGSLVWLENDSLTTYGIGVSRRDVIAVATGHTERCVD